MGRKKKNAAAMALGRLGGKAKSEAKTRAARANIRKRWPTSARAPFEQLEFRRLRAMTFTGLTDWWEFNNSDEISSPKCRVTRCALTEDQLTLMLETKDKEGTVWTGSMEKTARGYYVGFFDGVGRQGWRGTAKASGYLRIRENGAWRFLGDWVEQGPDENGKWYQTDHLWMAELELDQK